MFHQTPSLPTLSSSDRAWPVCYLESRNQPRDLVDKAKGRVSTGKKQLAGIIVVDKKWKYISVSYVSPAPLSGAHGFQPLGSAQLLEAASAPKTVS